MSDHRSNLEERALRIDEDDLFHRLDCALVGQFHEAILVHGGIRRDLEMKIWFSVILSVLA